MVSSLGMVPAGMGTGFVLSCDEIGHVPLWPALVLLSLLTSWFVGG